MPLNVRNEIRRWRVVLAVGLIVAVLGIWWGTLPRPYSARKVKEIGLAIMFNALDPAREAAKEYVRDHGTLKGVELAEKDHLPPARKGFQYLVLNDSVLVGINYETQYTLVFTPKMDDKELRWQCYEFSEDTKPFMCSPRLLY